MQYTVVEELVVKTEPDTFVHHTTIGAVINLREDIAEEHVAAGKLTPVSVSAEAGTLAAAVAAAAALAIPVETGTILAGSIAQLAGAAVVGADSPSSSEGDAAGMPAADNPPTAEQVAEAEQRRAERDGDAAPETLEAAGASKPRGGGRARNA